MSISRLVFRAGYEIRLIVAFLSTSGRPLKFPANLPRITHFSSPILLCLPGLPSNFPASAVRDPVMIVLVVVDID